MLFVGGASAAAPDNSLSFASASSEYVRFGAAGATTDKLNAATFTLEVWFNRTGAGIGTDTSGAGGGGFQGAIPLLAKGRGEADMQDNRDINYFLGLDSAGHVAVDYEEGSGQTQPSLNHGLAGATVVTQNAWHHAAATFDGTTLRVYLDGRLDGTLNVGSSRGPRSDSIQRTAIGSALTSTGTAAGFFLGGIDEARVWNVARTGQQVRDAKDDELTSGTGLVGRWGLDEGAPATTVADSTANPITGTLVNTPTWVANQYAFPQDGTAPAAPLGVGSVAASNSVTVSWNANSETDLAGYNVFRATSSPVPTGGTPLNGNDLVPTGAAPSFTDSTAVNGQTYFYAVVAVDGSNNSSSSSETSATPSATLTGLLFDGTDDHVAFGQATSELGATVFTLETWFKRTGAGMPMGTGTNGLPDGTALPLVTKGRGQAESPANLNMNYFLGLDAATNRLVADFEDTVNGGNHPALAATGTLAASPGVWHHAAATYNGSEWRLYLDGQLDRAVNVGTPGQFTPESTSMQHAALGSALTSTGATGTLPGFFRGVLDEARIWNVVRTPSQIQTSMSQELTTGTGLRGRWGLNDGSGTTADNSVGAPDGTLTGGPAWVVGYPFTPVPPSDPVFVGAGDIAGTWSEDEDTALLLDGIPGTVFTIGDNVYPDGTASEFSTYYVPTWGRHKARTRPTAGNHDYNTPGATGYYGYFNDGNPTGPAGDNDKGYYSYDIEGDGFEWHIVVLNSECETPGGLWQPGGCAAGSTQEQWLRTDLANASTNNIIALMHKPRYSSTALMPHMQALWQALYDHGVDVALSGHWHNYERLAPMNPAGVTDTTYGVRQFVVGTGGVGLGGLGSPWPASQESDSNSHGVIKFTLHETSYEWEFIPIEGDTYTDSGTTSVHGPPPVPVDNALRFDGTNDHVTFGQATNTLGADEFTLETWFRRSGDGVGTGTGSGGITSAVPLVTKGRAEQDTPANLNMNYFLGINASSGVLVADFEDDTGGQNHPVSGTTAIAPDNTWHHAAVTFDGSFLRLYLDGKLEGKLDTGGETPESSSIQHAALATAIDSTGAEAGFFDGDLDEVRIWDIARSGAEIRSSKDDEIPTPQSGLKGRWGLNEGTGTTAGDSSGNGVNGALTDGPAWIPGYAFPQDAVAPTDPSGLNAAAGDTQIALSWTANGDPDLAGYNLYRSTSSPVPTAGTPVNGGDLIRATAYTDTGLSNGTTYFYALRAVDGSNNASGASAEANATPVQGDPVLVGAGDIADCNRTQDTATANLVAATPGTVWTAGDNVYDDGTITEFNTCYDPTWGAFKVRTRPTAGNHDYGNGSNEGEGYFEYFNGSPTSGGPAGDPDEGYYSYDVGDHWHVVVLNSECYYYPVCSSSAQLQWLDLDLAANSSRNVVAMFHKPRWSSGASRPGLSVLQPLWQTLYDHGAEVVLTGHDHHYERFAPQDASGEEDTNFGVRQFVVGTGGAAFTGLGTTADNSEIRNNTTYGVLKLTLHPTSYDWQFMPISGQTFTDTGTGFVHGAPNQPVGRPVADFDGDGDTDVSIYRPSEGVWYVKDQLPYVQWGGQSGDIPVPGDYDGDRDTDIATYRPSEGVWYVKDQLPYVQWGGATGDIPLVLAPAIRLSFFP